MASRSDSQNSKFRRLKFSILTTPYSQRPAIVRRSAQYLKILLDLINTTMTQKLSGVV